MLKISHAGCLGLSPATLVQFTLEVHVAARNRGKFTKTSYFRGSRSSMLTFLRSSLPVLVTISSMSVPICNHFHVRKANNGRITLFKGGAPLSPPRSWRPPSLSNMKFCNKKLETLSYQMVKNQKSLSHLAFDRYRVVTNTKTDTKTELNS